MSELERLLPIVREQRDALYRATDGISAIELYEDYCRARQKAEDHAVGVLEAEGAKIGQAGDTTSFRLAGLRSESTTGLPGALSNWAVRAALRIDEEAAQ